MKKGDVHESEALQEHCREGVCGQDWHWNRLLNYYNLQEYCVYSCGDSYSWSAGDCHLSVTWMALLSGIFFARFQHLN